MRHFWATVLILSASFCAMSQDDTPKPKVSEEPLTTEQVAVYRAVLSDYLKGSDGELNLADMTEPLDRTDNACLEGIGLAATKIPAPLLHRLEPSLVSNTKITLVDAEHQQTAIRQNDPQNLMKKAIDDHEKVTNEQVDESVKQAFQTGLFTLSEIVFDKKHRRAVVAYGFVCGMLCGHGNTVVLKKIGQQWKVKKTCGGWIS